MNYKSKKRICIISDSENVFDVRKFYKDAISLSKNNYQVLYITHGPEAQNFMSNDIKIKIVKTNKYLPTNPFTNFNKFICALKSKSDYYQFYSPYLLPFGAMLNILTKKPIIFVALEDYRAGIKEDKNINWITRILAGFFIYIAEALFLKKVSLIIASDDAIAENYNNKHPNVEIIYNFPVLDNFNPSRKNNKISDQYKNLKCVMYHGGITIKRGILDMIEAVSITAQEVKNLKFIIIGSGMNPTLQNSIHTIYQKYNSQNNISIIPPVDHKQIAYYINICHLGMVAFQDTPKLNKNIPQKIFEYMACKKPVIGSDLPPISHFLNLSKAGILVPPGNINAIADALKELLSNSNKTLELGENGYKFCTQRWNWNLMNEKLLHSYKKL